MTKNQLAYLELLEKRRANRSSEQLTALRDRETGRSNRANEQIKYQTLGETQRSNLAQEELKRQAQAETQRSNLRNERTDLNRLNEQARFNTLQARQKQHELEVERQRINLDIANQRNRTAIEQLKAEEQKRSNQANEQIASERNFITFQQLPLQYEQLAADKLRNEQTYEVNRQRNTETERSNKVEEARKQLADDRDYAVRKYVAEHNADIAEREHMLNVYKTPGAIINDVTGSVRDVIRSVIPFGR